MSLAPAFPTEEVNPALSDPFAGILGQGPASDSLWLGKEAPRYTSYPPATVFQGGFTAEDYKKSLRALPIEQPVSLYLHIPFCRSLCLYCGCHTSPTNNLDRIGSYLLSMQKEAETVSLCVSQAGKKRPVSRLHFGGGSPNILSEKDFGFLFGYLTQNFDISALKEAAAELDPRLVTKAQANILKLFGINRVSLGIQDFNPDVQKAIGREHSYAQISQVCFLLREAGIKRINFDLMYGLPLQSPVSMADTARLATTLKPDRISLFSYAHLPHIKPHQRALEAFVLPGPHTAIALENAARRALKDEGYTEIGMDHFARPDDSLVTASRQGRLHRSFQGYTDDEAPLLGLGASSIGRLPGLYLQNARDIDDYRQRISNVGMATVRGRRLTKDDLFRGAIINSLMCTMSVNLEGICAQTGFSLASLIPYFEALKPFEDAGLVRREGVKITLITPHRMAIRVIASLFDAYAPAAPGCASKVV